MPLKRRRHAMPAFVREALEAEGLMDEYSARPDYQQNDYIWWINDARREETRQRRLRQMLDELRRGGVYMNIDHPPSRKS
jgi:uncharacterized protein YdeI (YjbR/CyaY-like superfamily)